MWFIMKTKIFYVLVLVVMIIAILGGVVHAATTVNYDEQNGEIQSEDSQTTQNDSKDKGMAMIAAALSTGLACLGAGIAVALVGSSAVGAISENPSLLGKTIIFAGLAEGIAIYGLIISIMILNQ